MPRKCNILSFICCLSFLLCTADTALHEIQLKFSCPNPPAWPLLLLFVLLVFAGLNISQLLFRGFCYFHSTDSAPALFWFVCKSPRRLSTDFDSSGWRGGWERVVLHWASWFSRVRVRRWFEALGASGPHKVYHFHIRITTRTAAYSGCSLKSLEQK